MEKMVTRDEIVKQAEKLAFLIAQSEEVDFFKKAEAQVNSNDKVQQLINAIKLFQKHAVQYEHYEKKNALDDAEHKLENLQQELDEIPIVQEFKQSQLEVNDLLQMITSIISNTVTDQIILATGGDPLSGKTGSANQNSCPIK